MKSRLSKILHGVAPTAWSAGAAIAAATPDARAGTSNGAPLCARLWIACAIASADCLKSKASELLHDPWAARNDYIDVVLDRSPDSLWLFFEKHSRHQLKPAETVDALKLLEMQRHAMLMYTSCGWFFDELSGIESVQVMQYAGRVIQLARETGNVDPEPEFLRRLALAQSNLPEMGDGATIYNRWVAPAFVDLCKVGAHFAISSMFNGDHIVPQYCYSIKSVDYRHAEAGTARLALGISRVTSRITRERANLRFAAVYLGDQVLHAGVRELEEKEDYDGLVAESMAAFSSGDFGELLRLLDDTLTACRTHSRPFSRMSKKGFWILFFPARWVMPKPATTRFTKSMDR